MLHQTDLSRVDLNLLVLFEAVANERNVARAAGRLSLSASAVSHGLARLRRLFNDPLFLRTPKGVVPTERGMALAQPIADILLSVRKLVSSGEQFDPATSDRRFVVGAPDAGLPQIIESVLALTPRSAPRIDLAFVSILPKDMGWTNAFASLDERQTDVMILPFAERGDFSEAPARFAMRPLFEVSFVVAMRQGHPMAAGLTLDQYCAMQHVVVSATGSRDSNIDAVLTARNLSRRVSITVPNSLMAFDVVANSDLILATPGTFLQHHADRFGLTSTVLPITLPQAEFRAVVPKAALADKGILWLLDTIERASFKSDLLD